jgi:hypothetical protein
MLFDSVYRFVCKRVWLLGDISIFEHCSILPNVLPTIHVGPSATDVARPGNSELPMRASATLASRNAGEIDSESTQLELLRSGVEWIKMCQLTELLLA